MAKWRNLAKRLPRFSVGTLLIVTACCAIGLAVGMSPPEENENLVSWNLYVPQLNWHFAFLAMATSYLIVELLQQQHHVNGALPSSARDTVHAGWKCAVYSRRLLALILAVLLFSAVLTRYRIIEFVDRDEFLFALSDELFPDVVWFVSYFLGLAVVAYQPRGIKVRGMRAVFDCFFAWLAGALFLLYVATDSQLITYLVHLATAGIEASRAFRSQMLGAFPNHQQEGWFTFYVSLAALGLILLAVNSYLLLLKSRSSQHRVALFNVFLLSIFGATCYSVWFFGWEYFRVSPDLAGQVGKAAMARDWFSAAMILSLATIAGAFQLSRMPKEAGLSIVTPFRASGMVLLTSASIFVSLLLRLVESIRLELSLGLGGFVLISELLAYWISNPNLLMQIAINLLAVHIAWRWLRHGAPEIVIQPIEPRRVFWAWLGLVALVIVGVPVIAAFGFCWWLGPWYL